MNAYMKSGEREGKQGGFRGANGAVMRTPSDPHLGGGPGVHDTGGQPGSAPNTELSFAAGLGPGGPWLVR